MPGVHGPFCAVPTWEHTRTRPFTRPRRPRTRPCARPVLSSSWNLVQLGAPPQNFGGKCPSVRSPAHHPNQVQALDLGSYSALFLHFMAEHMLQMETRNRLVCWCQKTGSGLKLQTGAKPDTPSDKAECPTPRGTAVPTARECSLPAPPSDVRRDTVSGGPSPRRHKPACLA